MGFYSLGSHIYKYFTATAQPIHLCINQSGVDVFVHAGMTIMSRAALQWLVGGFQGRIDVDGAGAGAGAGAGHD